MILDGKLYRLFRRAVLIREHSGASGRHQATNPPGEVPPLDVGQTETPRARARLELSVTPKYCDS